MFLYELKEFSDIIKFYTVQMLNFDESEELEMLNDQMILFLLDKGYSADQISILDYKIQSSKNSDVIKIMANNLATALWFSDIYPENMPDRNEKEIQIDDVIYKFNKGKIKKVK
jgi:hypothetical protein